MFFFFLFKQKTAYEMRISDWSSDVCSSDLAYSYDEEIGCVGAPSMIQDLINRGVNPSGCVVGEPTSMRAIVAHKGINVYRCRVHGHAAHSSQIGRASCRERVCQYV